MSQFTQEDIETIRQSEIYDCDWYLETYPEVKLLGMDPAMHYLRFGAQLGRNPGPKFDMQNYLTTYTDVADSGINPLLHYEIYGKQEGRKLDPIGRLIPRDHGVGVVLPVPLRREINRQGILTLSEGREHFWYHTPDVEKFLDNFNSVSPMPKHIKSVLIIAHNFSLTTGVSRPLSHYLNAITQTGQTSFSSVELSRSANAEEVRAYAEVHDFVIINSIDPLFSHDGMIELALELGPEKLAVYLHETSWIFEKLKAKDPARFKKFVAALPRLNILCSSKMQQDWLISEYGLTNSALLFETTNLTSPVPKSAFSAKLDMDAPLSIAMVGTMQPRKGVSLFSEVADLAYKAGLPWKFTWMGSQVCKDHEIYKSQRVNWRPSLPTEAYSEFLASTDVLFLASEDDPFPLCVLEALKAYKRTVVYRKTGVAEIFSGVNSPGVVFNDYSPNSAFEAIKQAVGITCTRKTFHRLNQNYSLEAFSSRLHKAIGQFASSEMVSSSTVDQSTAIFARIFDQTDLFQLNAFLCNFLRGDNVIHFLIDGSDRKELINKIRARFTNIVIHENDHLENVLRKSLPTLDNQYVVILDAPTEEISGGTSYLPATTIAFARLFKLFDEHPDILAVREKAGTRPFLLSRTQDALSAFEGKLNPQNTLTYNPEVPKPVNLLRGRHEGNDIYVVGSGASTNFLDPSFFTNKIVIGVNRVFMNFPCTYNLFKEYNNKEAAVALINEKRNVTPIVSFARSGNTGKKDNQNNTLFFQQDNTYFFDHADNGLAEIDLEPIESDDGRMVVSWSSITSAMHLAAYMGAKNIILVGHDCALIDGKSTYDGYYNNMKPSPWENSTQYDEWLDKIEPQSLAVRGALKKKFNCTVTSLNPFINLGLEGAVFSRNIHGLSGDKDQPILLLCNGPSARNMRVPENLDDYLIARMNFFFLEEKPFADGRVDTFFWAVDNSEMHKGLREAVRSKRYKIDRFYCPLSLTRLSYGDTAVSEDPFCTAEKLCDHWKLIAQHPILARFIMSRPFPTTGLQALAALAIAGYRKFAIAGMDFYSRKKTEDRYFYEVPDQIKKRLDPRHTTPGYEKGAHNMKTDIIFLEEIVKVFPTLEIELLSDMQIMQDVLEGNANKHLS